MSTDKTKTTTQGYDREAALAELQAAFDQPLGPRPHLKYKIYQDMDGCVADFSLKMRQDIMQLAQLSDEQVEALESKTVRTNVRKYIAKFGREHQLQDSELKDKVVQKLLYKLGGEKGFFFTLPPMHHNGLWHWLERSGFQFDFLTAPIGEYAEADKTRWVREVLGCESPVHVVKRKEKVQFATPESILIDDHPDTIEMWNAAGGKGFLWTGQQGGDLEALKTWLSELP